MIPPFEESGNLPAGIHEATWNEFSARYGTTPHRRNLLDGLGLALVALRRAGCRRAQKSRFGGELFPADLPADPEGTQFLDHFQRDKHTREPKGIVAIDLKDLP